MSIGPGTRLGPYEIVSRIGAGGMGEVWRALDKRLDRSVAVKILPPELTGNAQLKIRFEREARTISQLSHAHICTLYDVGSDGGVEYLVMELLEGESLADRLGRGPLPVDEVLRYGVEIAEALDEAHRHGVVHRDLKPGNVMLTKHGAKLLDFGLAKSVFSASLSDAPDDATVARSITEKGSIVGTFHYMAPEQVEGKELDARADIWALGCVLFEMATGRVPFAAPSRASLIGSILRDEPPPPSHLQPAVPRALDRVIRMCLAKNADQRWQSARDIASELRWIAEERHSSDSFGAAPAAAAPRVTRRALIAAAVIVPLALLAGWLAWRAAGNRGANAVPVIVLMDSTHPLRVYDPETRARGGTNADDLTDLLHDLPVVLLKENTTWTWHREDEVLRQNPDLLLVHRSCFYVPLAIPVDPASEHELYARAWDKLEAFLGYLALGNPRTKFFVYSRKSWASAAERDAWVTGIERRFPQLKGRVQAWMVPLDRATFRNPQTGAEVRKQVIAMLGLKQ